MISVITVVYNDKENIYKTIQSVLSQNYNKIEYIIIDGGSTDGTLDIINRYKDKINYLVSEKDLGTYDAMNKGIKIANGDFINFINSGDILFEPNSIGKIVNSNLRKNVIYFSRAEIIADNISWFYPGIGIKDYEKWLKSNLPNHQTMFFPKLFYKNNSYNLKLPIRADDYYKLLGLNSFCVKFIDSTYVKFYRGGISSNHKSLKLLKQRMLESFIINAKYKRLTRYFIDPFKLLLFFSYSNIFGETAFTKLIKSIVRLKKYL